MKLKLDENGNVVLMDGKPVYVTDDGKERTFDAAQMYGRINALTSEAADSRKRADELERNLKKFEGIDPGAAAKALETIKNIDDKQLVDAGEVEKIKSEATKAITEQLAAANKVHATEIAERDEKYNALESMYNGEKIGGSFTGSKFIKEKVAVPPDMLQAQFGNNFKVEGGKMIAYNTDGNKMYSVANPGELAPFEEAIELLVNAYPHKDSILRGTGNTGGGQDHGGEGGGAGSKVMTRSEYEKMDPSTAAAKFAEGFTLVDNSA